MRLFCFNIPLLLPFLATRVQPSPLSIDVHGDIVGLTFIVTFGFLPFSRVPSLSLLLLLFKPKKGVCSSPLFHSVFTSVVSQSATHTSSSQLFSLSFQLHTSKKGIIATRFSSVLYGTISAIFINITIFSRRRELYKSTFLPQFNMPASGKVSLKDTSKTPQQHFTRRFKAQLTRSTPQQASNTNMFRPEKAEDWEEFREIITALYQSNTLSEVIVQMKTQHFFSATYVYAKHGLFPKSSLTLPVPSSTRPSSRSGA